MFVEYYDHKKTENDFQWEPELKAYFIPGLTTNGYPDYRWEHDFVLRQVGNASRSPHKILDAGGGTGVLQILLQKRGHEVHNADRDKSIVAKITAVNTRFKTNIQPYSTDLIKTPFKDNFFDGVVSVSSLEHNLPAQMAKSVQEMIRVVRPGGYLALTIPVAATDKQTWDARVYALWRWDPEKLREALEDTLLTGLPSFVPESIHENSIARAYGVHRMIYPVGIFMRKRGW